MRSRTGKALAVAVVIVSFAGGRALQAQALADSALHPGARIRVTSSVFGRESRIGSFISLTEDTLAFAVSGGAQQLRIPVRQVDALELSVRRTTNIVRDADKGSHYGGWIGALVGAGLGVAGASSGDNTLRALLGFVGAIGGYFTGQLYGTVAGGVAGAVNRDDEWKPVMLPAKASAVPPPA